MTTASKSPAGFAPASVVRLIGSRGTEDPSSARDRMRPGQAPVPDDPAVRHVVDGLFLVDHEVVRHEGPSRGQLRSPDIAFSPGPNYPTSASEQSTRWSGRQPAAVAPDRGALPSA